MKVRREEVPVSFSPIARKRIEALKRRKGQRF